MNKHTWELIKNLSNAIKKVQKFHQQYLSNPSSFLVEFVAKKGGDVTNANAMGFVHMWFIINLYLNFNLILVHF